MAWAAELAVVSIMNIVILVTPITSDRQFLFVKLPLMTGIATDFTVLFFEGVFCFVVVEGCAFPLLWIVAFFAFLIIASPMPITAFMTGITGRPEFICIHITGVAYITMDLDVPIFEWEFGLVMIEDRAPPILFVVAFVAFFAIAVIVEIVGLVAGVTIGNFYIADRFVLIMLEYSLFPTLCVVTFVAFLGITSFMYIMDFMAGITIGNFYIADRLDLIVLEYGLFPVICVVTLVAHLGIVSIMDVIEFVAGITIVRYFLIKVTGMAPVTINFFMFAL
jgi:hypothetical protein